MQKGRTGGCADGSWRPPRHRGLSAGSLGEPPRRIFRVRAAQCESEAPSVGWAAERGERGRCAVERARSARALSPVPPPARRPLGFRMAPRSSIRRSGSAAAPRARGKGGAKGRRRPEDRVSRSPSDEARGAGRGAPSRWAGNRGILAGRGGNQRAPNTYNELFRSSATKDPFREGLHILPSHQYLAHRPALREAFPTRWPLGGPLPVG